jgi:membrane protease YdiL (CAAX protease family)
LWQSGFNRLGFSSWQLAPGIVKGLLASLIILPLMLGVMLGTEWLWNRIHFEHPTEHDLLQILGETSSPPMKLAIIASAIFLAPLFEELLFRGYLQSALLATFLRWRGRTEAWTATGPRWVAIIVASIAFTLVHQHLWLMPPIFFLSICLGYAYERTNNLWVTIFVHAAFNGVSTLVFLITR